MAIKATGRAVRTISIFICFPQRALISYTILSLGQQKIVIFLIYWKFPINKLVPHSHFCLFGLVFSVCSNYLTDTFRRYIIEITDVSFCGTDVPNSEGNMTRFIWPLLDFNLI